MLRPTPVPGSTPDPRPHLRLVQPSSLDALLRRMLAECPAPPHLLQVARRLADRPPVRRH